MPLSSKQMEYLALAWQCFETEPKIDYEKFHRLANLSSAASARELMRVTKKKLKEEYGALGSSLQDSNADATGGTPVKPKGTPRGKGGKGRETPKSGGKKAGGKKARAEMEMEEGDDDVGGGEETPRKKVKVEGCEGLGAGDGDGEALDDLFN